MFLPLHVFALHLQAILMCWLDYKNMNPFLYATPLHIHMRKLWECNTIQAITSFSYDSVQTRDHVIKAVRRLPLYTSSQIDVQTPAG